MLPGFVDAHGHVFAGGIQALSANLLAPPDGEVKDIAALQQTLRDRMAAYEQAVEKRQLVVGFGYDNAQLAELRPPTREDLDEVSKDLPVILIHQSGHLAAANSKALEIGGITADTPNPDGGVIQRREGSQEPNGVLEETAAFPLIMKLLGRVGSDGATAFIRAGSDLWARFGYTTEVIPSLFPMHTFYWGDWHRDHTVGPVLAENISPTGWCVQRGMKFTAHHDAPVAFPDSMRVLDATVTRRSRSGDILGPQQRVDVMTALKAMTIWPAWQHFEEKTKGSIETGKLADLIILDKDPTAVDPETLDTIKVTQTIKEGVTVYLAGDKQGARLPHPDKGGEHAFSHFIRHAAAEESHDGHDHGGAGAQSHCCGCRIAAILGDALASSSGR